MVKNSITETQTEMEQKIIKITKSLITARIQAYIVQWAKYQESLRYLLIFCSKFCTSVRGCGAVALGPSTVNVFFNVGIQADVVLDMFGYKEKSKAPPGG